MAGAIRLGELTHIMESRIEAALEASEFPPELFAELEEKMDRLSLDVERMQGTGGAGRGARPHGRARCRAAAFEKSGTIQGSRRRRAPSRRFPTRRRCCGSMPTRSTT